jgi:hypothetical protein
MVTLILTVTETPVVDTYETICQGGSVEFMGNNYTTTGTYSVSVDNGEDCMTEYVLYLTVNQILTETIEIAICEGGEYDFFGTTYTEEGIYTAQIKNETGCDVLVTLVLTVTETPVVETYETICQGGSVEFMGNDYTIAGTYSVIFDNGEGCMVEYILYLTVDPILKETIDYAICDGATYNFFGDILTESGIYTTTYTNASGCDVEVTLTLTITPMSVVEISAAICASETYNFHGDILTVSGTYEKVIPSLLSGECESIEILTLIVNEVYYNELPVMICEGGAYEYNGELYTQAGNYPHIFKTVNGCDSTVMLIVTVNEQESIPVYETICAGAQIEFHGEVFTTTGIYPVMVDNGDCLIEYVLHLTVEEISITPISAFIYHEETYDFFGEILTEAGVYTHTLTSIHGCDSIIELTLVVLLDEFAIIATFGPNGTITPSGITVVTQGQSVTYTFTPDVNYAIETVTINGKVQNGTGSSYTFNNIKANHTIEVTFVSTLLSVTATASANGTITPAGIINVEEGGSITLAFTPDEGYKIESVLVNGKEDKKAVTDGFVTLKGIKNNQTVHVTFSTVALTVTASAGLGGTISPEGIIYVAQGGTETFTFTPNAGYRIDNVLVNGKKDNKAIKDGFVTLKNIKSHQTVHVTFIGTNNAPPLEIEENIFANVKVYSHQNIVYIKNENNVALKLVEIFDLNGRKIYQNAITNDETAITLNVENTIYFVRLISQENQTMTTKVYITNNSK